MPDKWLIYLGDAYYPYRELFDTYEAAKAAWEKLRQERAADSRRGKYWDGDYLCQIYDSNIPDEIDKIERV